MNSGGSSGPGCNSCASCCRRFEIAAFFLATVYLPLADVVTYYLATPIFVTALSAIFLREQVGWRRWSAILIGFCGVLIALRPSAQTVSWPAMIALAGSLAFSCSLLITRSVARHARYRAGLGAVRGRAAVWSCDCADRLGHADMGQPRAFLCRRRDLGVRAALRQPFAEARASLDRRAVSIHDDPLGGDVRLCRVRRRAVVCDGAGRGHHHRRGALYFPARARTRAEETVVNPPA